MDNTLIKFFPKKMYFILINPCNSFFNASIYKYFKNLCFFSWLYPFFVLNLYPKVFNYMRGQLLLHTIRSFFRWIFLAVQIPPLKKPFCSICCHQLISLFNKKSRRKYRRRKDLARKIPTGKRPSGENTLRGKDWRVENLEGGNQWGNDRRRKHRRGKYQSPLLKVV